VAGIDPGHREWIAAAAPGSTRVPDCDDKCADVAQPAGQDFPHRPSAPALLFRVPLLWSLRTYSLHPWKTDDVPKRSSRHHATDDGRWILIALIIVIALIASLRTFGRRSNTDALCSRRCRLHAVCRSLSEIKAGLMITFAWGSSRHCCWPASSAERLAPAQQKKDGQAGPRRCRG